jgi:glycosyltransferase involved in cell wall biosynthesis
VKIAIDIRPLSPRRSGVGYYIRNLLRAIGDAETGDRLLLWHHSPQSLERGTVPAHAEVVRAPFSHESHPLGDLWRDVALPRAIRRRGADVFHGPAFALPRDRRGFACVVTIHDLAAFRHPETLPRRYGIYLRAQVRAAIARADRIIAISRAEGDELRALAGGACDRVRVVHHGVEPRFRPIADARAADATLARLGIARPYALHLGNIEPRKNLAGAFRAFERFRARTRAPHALVVAGASGWLETGIHDAARRMPPEARPIFTGYVAEADVPAVVGSASMFLFPSLYEGFGLPILEAMACGVPVVTSDRGAMREVAGSAALLADPLDPEAIAAQMARLVEEPGLAERLAALGRERAALFRWETTARETLAVYREAAGAV